MRILLIQAVLFLVLVRSSPAATNELWFPVGEKLIYKLYWGIIPVGRAEFSVEWIEEDGRKLLSLKGNAKTTSIIAKLYPVDDFIESVVDPATFLPIRYVQRLEEGRHLRHDKIIFDHKNSKARWESELDGSSKELEIDSQSRDILCFVYYMRSKGFASGKKEKFRVLADEKVYDLELIGLGHQELKVRGFGKVKCLKMEPKAKFGEIFVRGGRVRLWFSTDTRRLCVKMTGKVPLASIKAFLIEVKGPGNDKWSPKKEEKKEDSK